MQHHGWCRSNWFRGRKVSLLLCSLSSHPLFLTSHQQCHPVLLSSPLICFRHLFHTTGDHCSCALVAWRLRATVLEECIARQKGLCALPCSVRCDRCLPSSRRRVQRDPEYSQRIRSGCNWRALQLRGQLGLDVSSASVHGRGGGQAASWRRWRRRRHRRLVPVTCHRLIGKEAILSSQLVQGFSMLACMTTYLADTACDDDDDDDASRA